MAGGYAIDLYDKTGNFLGGVNDDANMTVSEFLSRSVCTNNGVTAISLTQGGSALSNDYEFDFGIQDLYNVYDVTPEPIQATPITGFMRNGTEYIFHDPQVDGVEELLAAI